MKTRCTLIARIVPPVIPSMAFLAEPLSRDFDSWLSFRLFVDLRGGSPGSRPDRANLFRQRDKRVFRRTLRPNSILIGQRVHSGQGCFCSWHSGSFIVQYLCAAGAV